ncbi:MAG: hypothetical protein WBA39_13920 [Rivularia sp. (in: cyanobacteria)]
MWRSQLVMPCENNGAEVIVNDGFFIRNIAKLKLTVEQFFPNFGDVVRRDLDVNELNQT